MRATGPPDSRLVETRREGVASCLRYPLAEGLRLREVICYENLFSLRRGEMFLGAIAGAKGSACVGLCPGRWGVLAVSCGQAAQR